MTKERYSWGELWTENSKVSGTLPKHLCREFAGHSGGIWGAFAGIRLGFRGIRPSGGSVAYWFLQGSMLLLPGSALLEFYQGRSKCQLSNLRLRKLVPEKAHIILLFQKSSAVYSSFGTLVVDRPGRERKRNRHALVASSSWETDRPPPKKKRGGLTTASWHSSCR